MVLDKEIQKIINRTPKVQDLPHVFYSKEADLNLNGTQTVRVLDEFGKSADVSFVGGCSIGVNGAVVPASDEVPLAAEPESYQYLGYMDDKGVLVRTDHTPEIPLQAVSIPTL